MPVKCLIPAAGKGTRMRPLTHTLPKAMLPVAGKPSIYHIIDRAAKAGVEDFVIITGYLRELMESEILAAYPKLKIQFVEQKEQLGLGHAIYMARDKFAAGDSMLLIYGDTLFEGDIETMMKSATPVIGVFEVPDPKRFGVIEKGEGQTITNLVEKPEKFVSNLAIPGVNYFPSSAELFAALEHIVSNNIRTKNEYQATDAFQYMLKEKKTVFTWQILTAWDDAGTLEAILDTNKIILDRRGAGKMSAIAADAKIVNSQLQQYASVSEGAHIENSTLINCIVDRGSVIKNCKLENSLVGRNAVLENISGTIVVGDDTQVRGR
ncbi:sugar nucleotidyltransferase [Turneriella parva]|uniref:Nucleotidyl transferase n=1 Tax=Turneriella parva (strain ATCC BAA-1111 / DSM 21527 / NCTC 11395 / H) TaxID=869212 RepID=I4B446_TURPD|nr:sugar phosphate nucleotidyltransferase [Turneriella parva]AFM12053.1 Nucleotidyl transferase [Turneriella parva DSM 21527]